MTGYAPAEPESTTAGTGPGPSRWPWLVAIVAVLLLGGGAVAIILTHQWHRTTTRVYQIPAVFKLTPGHCFNTSHNDLAISPRPCSRPHLAEAFARFSLPAGHYPGLTSVQSRADAGCSGRISGYTALNPRTSGYSVEAIYPNRITWQAGTRTVICALVSADGLVTGSVRG